MQVYSGSDSKLITALSALPSSPSAADVASLLLLMEPAIQFKVQTHRLEWKKQHMSHIYTNICWAVLLQVYLHSAEKCFYFSVNLLMGMTALCILILLKDLFI